MKPLYAELGFKIDNGNLTIHKKASRESLNLCEPFAVSCCSPD